MVTFREHNILILKDQRSLKRSERSEKPHTWVRNCNEHGWGQWEASWRWRVSALMETESLSNFVFLYLLIISISDSIKRVISFVSYMFALCHIIILLSGSYFINLALTLSHFGYIKLQHQYIWAAKLRKKDLQSLSFSVAEQTHLNTIRNPTIREWVTWQTTFLQISICNLNGNLKYVPKKRF